MGKGKRKGSRNARRLPQDVEAGRGFDRPDMARVIRGLVPWTREGLYEYWEYQHKLMATPKDDWDTRDHDVGVNLEEEDGSTTAIKFNQHHTMYQMSLYMKNKYGEEFAAHEIRAHHIQTFLMDHKTKLEEREFFRVADGGMSIATVLVDVLVKIPYTHRPPKNAMDLEYGLEFEDVMKAVEAEGESEEE